MSGDALTGLRPDLYERLAATNPFASRARKLFGRGQVMAVRGNEADLQVGYDARGNALELEQVPIVSGYAPQVGDWVAIGYEAGQAGAPWVMGPSMGADASADATGIGVFAVRSSDPAGAAASTIYFDESRGVWRGYDGTEWVDVAGGGQVTAHNALSGLQGGGVSEYYHLTGAEYGGTWGHALIATDASGAIPVQGIRSTALTNEYASALSAVHSTSGDMADGFAVGIAFGIRDSAGVVSTVGRLAVVRAGGDDTGDFVWLPGPALTEKMRLTSAGALSISAALTATGATLSGLTASRLLASDGSKGLASVADLSAWVAGTANRVTVANDGDGSITLSGPQDIDTAAGPTFAHLAVSSSSPVPASGQWLELAVSGGIGILLSYDRTNLVYLPTQIRGSTVTLVIGATAKLGINASGHVGIAAAAQFNWDGVTAAGDTYTAESSANYLLDTVGGTATFGRKAGHIGVPATGRVYLDGVACSGDTYIYETAANLLNIVAGGGLAAQFSSDGIQMGGKTIFTSGARIGGSGDTLAFFGAASVGQQAHIPDPGSTVAGCAAAILVIRTALQNLGLCASS